MHALQNYTRDNLAFSSIYDSGHHALAYCGNLWLRQAALARRRATLFAKNGPQISGWVHSPLFEIELKLITEVPKVWQPDRFVISTTWKKRQQFGDTDWALIPRSYK
jgi:hypothetical protein